MTAERLLYLDRKIKLALDFTEEGKISKDISNEIFSDLVAMFDDARAQRQFGEKAFIGRAKLLLVVMGRLRSILDGKPRTDLEALMDYLLTEVTKNSKATPP